MTKARMVLVALIGSMPTVALAHGAGGHAADPNLHVDASLEDCSVQFAPQLKQGAFGRFVREFGSVAAFKQASPPTTLGQWGFAVSVEQIWFSVEEKSDAWNDTFAHPDAYHELGTNLAFPKLHARVGITEDLDVGAFFTKNLTANYGWLGLEAKYALLRQSEEMPISLAVRGAYTKTLFVEDMDMHSLGAGASVGRTFWSAFTPYVGLGSDVVLARETSDAVELDTEVQAAPHALAGFEVRFWHVALGVEGQFAALPSYQAQLSAVF
jgi:opacity protein-like surface antigen